MQWSWPEHDNPDPPDTVFPGLNPIVGRLLHKRGFRSDEEIEYFLNPRLKYLEDPETIPGICEAVLRLDSALQQRQKILVFGDYDVDGISSVALLKDFLDRLGNSAHAVVPRRLEEGYGISDSALDRALTEFRPDLFIAVDCGTNSFSQIQRLQDMEVDVIVIDHHSIQDKLPTGTILVNPHHKVESETPWHNLSAVGLTFKLVHGFLKLLRKRNDSSGTEIDPREFLDLVCLGTIADLVPLTGENRIFASFGLKHIHMSKRTGLQALIKIAGLDQSSPLSATDIGFRLGPRINASGRLDEADAPIKLLISEDAHITRKISMEMDRLNMERQQIERAISTEAEKIVEQQFSDSFALVLYSPEWHPGVVGIVASRIARRFHRPAIVLGKDESGICKGSGRSIPGIDLIQAVTPCAQYLDKWGGHPMAVGLSLSDDQLNAFREALNDAVASQCGQHIPEKTLKIDEELEPRELNTGLLEALKALEPFGQGNEEPVFGIRNILPHRVRPMGKAHVQFSLVLPNGNSPVSAVAWNMADNSPPEGLPIQIAGKFSWNTWNGRSSPRFTVLDWKPVEANQNAADGSPLTM